MRILTSQEFKEKMLDAVLNRGKTDLSSISSSVKKIITDVRENGDEALLRYTEKFDNVRLTKSKLKVTKEEIKKAYEKLETDQINALKKATLNITRFHESQIRNAWSLETTKTNFSSAITGVANTGCPASYSHIFTPVSTSYA